MKRLLVFHDRRRMLLAPIAAATSSWMLAPRRALATDYPRNQPIRLIVPFPAGGGTDVIGRIVAKGLAQELKTTIFVENISGATGAIGLQRAARAEPDGYTLTLGISATHAIAPALLKDLPYKPLRDFVPVGRLAQTALIVVANPKFPANNVADLLALARKPGGGLLYGSWGNGSGGHLMMESVCHHGGVKMTQVPYKGEAPLLMALIGDEIQLGAASPGTAMPHVRAGRIKVLAVGGPRRTALLPDVATLVEQGVPFDTTSWYGLFAPARTPSAIVDELARALAAVLNLPELNDKTRELALEIEPTTRESFTRQIAADTAAWGRLIEVSGAKPD